MKVGDHVECAHDTDWQNEHRRSDSGGLRLRGFVPQVSQKDVRMSTQKVFR